MTQADAPVPISPLPVSYEDIRAAAERLVGIAHRTPVRHARSFDAAAGMAVWLKCEQFQRGGAFKFRGAYNKIATLSPEQRMRGVIAFSSGNHAQAVALVAGIFGVPAVICMPTDAPAVKVAATRGYGAEIVPYDRRTQDREALARGLAEARGLTLVPPYNDAAIIAGQGTATLELLEDMPDLDVIAAPVGGGGLIAGAAIAAHAHRPGMRVIGVETEAANHAALSLQRGERVSIPAPDTIADGIRTAQLGTLTWPVLQREVEAVVLVSEEEVKAAMCFLLLRLKLVVEPTGAVAAAAALAGKLRRYGGRAGVILSGGNVAPDVLRDVLLAAE
ncbi:MAG: pyridoxal-phosphate dependent enzyme [Ktedonobacterales bacterium]|nr:pyridoxal-phosphate dependent enzyme [Ktedonobacterales bacterium]